MKILLATKNEHKKQEIEALFQGSGLEIMSLKDMGFKGEIEENGTSFKENALIKARTIYDKFKIPTLADDSGLCIDGLNGEPGIHSAGFGGYDTEASIKNGMIIELLKGNSNRKAHYTCALAFIDEDRKFTVEKYCFGEIRAEEKGEGGFGYDPVFFLKDYGKTMAEIDLEEKNKISHRGQALREFQKFILESYIGKS